MAAGAGDDVGAVIVGGVDLGWSFAALCMSRILFLFSKNDSATPGRRWMLWTRQLEGKSSALS